MILLHAQAQGLKTGLPNPKTPPFDWWRDVIAQLDQPIVQIGVKTDEALVPDFRADLPFREIERLVDRCDYWLTVDSFLPHLASHRHKPGAVIWSVSDPLIFGYAENLNLLKDRRYLRARQFAVWEDQAYDADAFLTASEVVQAIAVWRADVETLCA